MVFIDKILQSNRKMREQIIKTKVPKKLFSLMRRRLHIAVGMDEKNNI